VDADLLVNGGELLPIGDSWMVLYEAVVGAVKVARVDRARAVAEKVLAMLEGRRWVVGLCGGDVEEGGRMCVRGKRVVSEHTDPVEIGGDEVDLRYSSDEALVAAQSSTPITFEVYLETSALAFLKRYLRYDLRLDIDFESGIEGVIA
jgi:hypothetical protein